MLEFYLLQDCWIFRIIQVSVRFLLHKVYYLSQTFPPIIQLMPHHTIDHSSCGFPFTALKLIIQDQQKGFQS